MEIDAIARNISAMRTAELVLRWATLFYSTVASQEAHSSFGMQPEWHVPQAGNECRDVQSPAPLT